MLTSSVLTAELIDRGITVAAGVVATLIGFGVIPRSPRNPGKPGDEARRLKIRKLCRWLGPILIVIGLVLTVEVLLRHG
jgi:hypothetical protein